MERKTIFVMLLAAMTAMAAGGCTRVSEPWDNTGYFKKERTRAADQQKELRERALEGQTDRVYG